MHYQLKALSIWSFVWCGFLNWTYTAIAPMETQKKIWRHTKWQMKYVRFYGGILVARLFSFYVRCFVCLRVVMTMLSLFLNCPFLIVHSVFSSVYWYLICRLKIHVKQRMSVYKISSKKSREIVNKTTLVEESTCNCYIWQIYVASCVNYTVWP